MGTVKKQKRARKKALKNRYCAGAKLSEHKFLRLLHGFAGAIPKNELERTTRVSGKTIRAIYKMLRANLLRAIQHHAEGFGGAGLLVFEDADDPHAAALLSAISQSRFHRRHVRRHPPRLSCPMIAQELVLESAVRLLCALDLRNVRIQADELKAQLAEGIIALKPRDPIQRLAKFVPDARAHAHASMRFYEDYRRYLLKNPLGTQQAFCARIP